MIQLLFLFALASEHAQVHVHFDRGEVSIVSKEFSLPKKIQRQIEDRLLMDFAARGLKKTDIVLEGQAVDAVAKDFRENKGSAKESLYSLLRLQIQNNQGLSVTGENARVFFGGHLVVGPGEKLSHVLVIGGEAEIFGNVDRLVQLGGSVHIHPGAQISSQIVHLNGTLEVEPGSHISNPPFSFKDILNFSILDHLNSAWLPQPFLFSGSVYWIYKILLWVFITIIGTLTANMFPKYHLRVQRGLIDRAVGNFVYFFIAQIILIVCGFLFLISVVGIPLIPLLFGFYYLCYWLAQAELACKIGRLLRVPSVGLSILVGLILLHLTAELPLMSVVFWILVMISFGSVYREMGFKT